MLYNVNQKQQRNKKILLKKLITKFEIHVYELFGEVLVFLRLTKNFLVEFRVGYLVVFVL